MEIGERLLLTYTGASQHVQLEPGVYSIECWGASGNGQEINKNTNSGPAGKGGYARAVLMTYKPVEYYAYVGGVGKASTSGIAEGGWNGGGCAWASDNSEPANGGGGASDIRLLDGPWDSEKGLLSRIIVAGGGGGGGEDGGDAGQAGGGNVGIGTYGATQNSASGGGVFGKGAHTNYDGGGGGGGWFGGGTSGGSQSRPTTNSSSDTSAAASGGSGYVATIKSFKPSGYIPTTENYLEGAELIPGNVAIPNPTGGLDSVGNLGDGYIAITCLSKPESNNNGSATIYVKVNGEWRLGTSLKTKVNGTWK